MAEAARSIPSSRREFMVFRVADQEFSVDVGAVREARQFSAAARVPHAPDYVRGVINLRGTILPIVDLRARLRILEADDAKKPVVVVVEMQQKVIGMMADAVCDIVEVDESALGPAPAVDDEDVQSLIKSVITIGERVIAVISPDAVLAGDGGAS